ncbi:Ca(2+)-dependent cysteine protease [Nowakowskiella sp. JEL0078]|nr:Ca(2+)-dependent cysteine protease [Nowakowskiella sp. JEL0078]
MSFGKFFAAATSGGGSDFLDNALDKLAGSLTGNNDGPATSNPQTLTHFGSAPPITCGCINDVHRVLAFVQKTAPFQDVLILTDDSKDPTRIPVRANIIGAMKWLVKDAQPGDSLFLHFSGHGATVKDSDGDEDDGLDSTIVPLDYQSAGQITDDEIHGLIAKPLPAGCRLMSIFDCCHSGSILDLPYTYLTDGNLDIVMVDNRKAAVKEGLKAGLEFIRGNKELAFKQAKEAFGMYIKPAGHVNSTAVQKTEKERTTQALVISFSGCQDSQTSADATIQGARSGAMSWALLEVLGQNSNLSYTEILKEVRGLLHGKYQQIPQLSTGYPIDLHTKFQI